MLYIALLAVVLGAKALVTPVAPQGPIVTETSTPSPSGTVDWLSAINASKYGPL